MVVCHEKPAFRQENRELYQYLDKTYVEAEVKEPVQGFARVCEGEPLQLTLQYEDPLTESAGWQAESEQLSRRQ